MKKAISFVLVLVMVLAFSGCVENVPKTSMLFALPFELWDIQDIVIYKKPNEPNSNERIGIEDAENIQFVYEYLDGIPVKESNHEIAAPGSTAYEFIFRLSNHTKVSVTYYAEAVKEGLITVNGDVYFTSSDIGWIWDNIDIPAETEHS